MKADKEEKELLAALEGGGLKSVPHAKKEIARYQRDAAAHFEKMKRLDIRVTQSDFLMHEP